MRYQILTGDCRATLATLPDASVQCCVTSPPYWGLRDYGTPEQIGLESTPDAYVAELVAVFREVRRVLKDDGVCWLNLGDSYAANRSYQVVDSKHTDVGNNHGSSVPVGWKPKDLVGIPWRVAFSLQADGWWLRSDVIWSKPNPMPESVTDRPTKSHEYVFLLAKAERYFYDAEAISEPAAQPDGFKYAGGYRDALPHVDPSQRVNVGNTRTATGTVPHFQSGHGDNRNVRTVWSIATRPYRDAHFAVMPEALATRCILAGSRVGDTVIDPFAGAGTTGVAALGNGRSFIGCEANPAYVAMADTRLRNVAPLFTEATA